MLPYQISVAGISELPDFAQERVSHVISLLDPDCPKPEALDGFAAHEWHEFRLHDVIHASSEHRRPETADVERLLQLGTAFSETTVSHLLVHCHMGMSRSTAAALILKTQFHPGREKEAVDALLAIRRPAWPNSRMMQLADHLLERGGALVAATETVYRETAQAFPQFVDFIRETPRKIEIPHGL